MVVIDWKRNKSAEKKEAAKKRLVTINVQTQTFLKIFVWDDMVWGGGGGIKIKLKMPL